MSEQQSLEHTARLLGRKEERERIIKLLEEHAVWVDEGGGIGCNAGCSDKKLWWSEDFDKHLIALIKGEK